MLLNALIFISEAVTYLKSRLKFPSSVDHIFERKKNVRKDAIKSHVFMVVRFSSFKQEWQDFRINSFCGLKHVLTAILGLFI